MRYPSPTVRRSRLVVLDAGVADLDVLLGGLAPDADVLLLSGDRDGLAQIDAAIARNPHLNELHLIAHGRPGGLVLGNRELNRETLGENAPTLQRWNLQAIALYGCHVAAGDAGREFLDRLHRLTGADLAASTTAIGHAALGGNWDLDVRSSMWTADVVVSEGVRRSYAGILANDDYTASDPVLANAVLNIAAADGVLANDGGGSALRDNSDSSAQGADVTVDNDGSFRYDPRDTTVFQQLPASGSLDDTFEYINNSGPATFTVTVRVNGVNDPPTASDFTAGTTTEDNNLTGNIIGGGFASDVDTGDSVSLVAETITSSRGATVTLKAGGDYTYNPSNASEIQALPAGGSLTDTFNYTARDSSNATSTGTVTVNITGENDQLNALDDTADAATGGSVTVDVLENDLDAEGGRILIFNFDGTSAKGGSISQSGDSLVYSAPADFIGEDTFSYTITDGLSSDTAIVTVTVNRPPNAEDDEVFNPDDAPTVRIPVTANDSDPDASLGDTFGIKSVDARPAAGGRLEILTNNTADRSDDQILYTPPAGYNGPNRFQYVTEDSLGGTDTATVIINPPDAVDDLARTRPARPVTIAVTDNDVLFSSVSIVGFETTGLNNGTISQDGNTLVYTSPDNFEGFDYFEYTVQDTQGNRDTATVEVLVSENVEIPQPPTPPPSESNPTGNNASITIIPPLGTPSPNVTLDTLEVESDEGENTLFGDDNPNTLNGKAGRDIMSGLGGNDNLRGGDGNDQLFGNAGNDFLLGEAGNDLIFSGADNDYIDGGDGDDEIAAQMGNDSIAGGLGDDLIFGNSGIDRIDGGDGADTVLGGQDPDILTGNLGDDVMAGDLGTDTVQGGDGSDTIFGNKDNDLLDGSRGDDFIYGGQGDDILFGAGGNDRLKGDLGNDILVGNQGADSFVVPDDGSVDTINDFSADEGDKLVLDSDLEPSDIVVQPNGNDTLIRIVNTDTVLAIVKNVPFDTIGSEALLFGD